MRVVIVGGVAGGMSCAARLRRVDETAEIIILERGPEVSFANCGLPYFVGGEIDTADQLLVQTPEKLRAALNLDARIHHDVIAVDPDARTVTASTPDGETTLNYDALVLSPGAQALRPPLPGLDSPRVRTLRTVADAVHIRDQVDSGAARAVVLGGGFIGIEAAEALRRQGLTVDVVELAPHILPPVEAELASRITDELRHEGVTVHEGVGAQAIEVGSEADTVVLADGTRLLADIVVLSVGVRPDTSVFAAAGVETLRGAIVTDSHGATSVPGIWAVGDAVISEDLVTGARRPVALAGPANRAGRLVADAIVNPSTARPIPRTLGTAILRMGRLTVAITGANRAGLRDSGIPFHTIHVHPAQHAGYFPGATPVSVVVHFRADTGLLLGAQAVGEDGVDKRIDVLATAIRAGMTVDDLIDLDLSYSPPYGQAKDVVTLIGMEGENVLRGAITLWYADQLDEVCRTALVLDVRSPEEFATGHLPGALNVAHTELRERLAEVRDAAAGRPVRLLCASGVRSYLAHRVLTQEGFDSATLSGGMATLRASLADRGAQLLDGGNR